MDVIPKKQTQDPIKKQNKILKGKKKMNKNTSKIVVFALALMLCVGFAFMANAENASPEIISKNMEYGEKFAIMYAVDASTVSEGPVTLKIYADADKANLVATYTAAAPQVENINGVDKSVYVFITNGVAPKDMADIFYAQAIDAQGKEGKLISYSVVEYMLERLYGGYELDDDQIAMYTKSLEFGEAAQNLLAKDDAIRVNDYKYVTIDGGTVNGAAKGMFLKGTVITPALASELPAGKYFFGWKDADGNAFMGNGVTVNGHLALSADIIDGDGTLGYYNKNGGYNLTGLNTTAGSDAVWSYFESGTPKLIDRAYVSGQKKLAEPHMGIYDIDGDNALVLSAGTSGCAYKYPMFAFNFTSDGDAFVYESDIYLGEYKGNGSDPMAMQIAFAGTGGIHVAQLYTTYTINAVSTENGYAYDVFGNIIEAETWFNLGVKYVPETGKVDYYLNSKLVKSDVVAATTEAPRGVRFCAPQTADSYVAFDNIFVGAINLDTPHLSESDEYYTFNDGVVPSAIQQVIYGGGNGLSVVDAPVNDTTDKVLNLNSDGSDYAFIPVANYNLEGATGFVFESKVRVVSALDAFALQLQINTPNKSARSHETFTFTKATSQLQLDDWDANGTGNHKNFITMSGGTWFDLKVVGKVDADGKFSATYYIDGVEVAKSVNTAYAATKIADIYWIGFLCNHAIDLQLDDVRFVKTVD